MEKFNITVIGAGIVGLAISSKLPPGNNLVLEQYESFGKETSSRNSEVIHAGIYYPKDSLKSKLCVKGNEMVYSICKKNNINHKQLGKIVVAVNDEEQGDLETLYQHGLANGVSGLRMISQQEVKQYEPEINAVCGIYSATTGIVDTHNLMRYFELQAKDNGVLFAYGCELIGIDKVSHGYKIMVRDADGQIDDFFTRVIVNCAGLNSDKVARMAGINDYCLHYCKGEYFSVGNGKSKRIHHLVYPVPSKISLGVHTVVDLQGQFKLGPNAHYVTEIDYQVADDHLDEIYESAKQYLPFIEKEDLSPDMAGIRPKLQASGEEVKDFVVSHEAEKGLIGFINLIGIESPGLTASPAIAEYVIDELKKI